MGISIKKRVITGSFFHKQELTPEFIEDCLVSNKNPLGTEVKLIQLNPFDESASNLHEYIIGIDEEHLEGDGAPATTSDEEYSEEITTNQKSTERLCYFKIPGGDVTKNIPDAPIRT